MADSQKKADFRKKFAGVKRAAGGGDGDGLPKLNPCRILANLQKASSLGENVDSLIILHGDSSKPFGETNPFLASISSAEYLTPVVSTSKRVLSIELNIEGYDIQYQPGDYLCVGSTNPSELVDAIAARLSLDLDDVITVTKAEGIPDSEGFPAHIKTPCTVRHLFTNYCDFTVAPTKKLLRMLGENSCGEDKTKLLHLASTAGREDYIKFLNGHPSFLDILNAHPTCTPPLAYTLDLLPPLTPRDYSIASSPLTHPQRVIILFSVVEFVNPINKLVKGICTNWLEAQVLKRFPHLGKDTATHVTTNDDVLANSVSQLKLSEPDISVKIPVFYKASAFRMPADLQQPIIMVGPGSGVAPFLGFVDYRLSSTDYVSTRDHLTKLAEQGTITKFVCAFSRDEEGEVVYVQHKLVEHGEEIYRLMTQQNAKMFVCGDAKGMAVGVKDAIVTILKTHGNVNDKEAMETLASWSKEKRYQLDIWF